MSRNCGKLKRSNHVVTDLPNTKRQTGILNMGVFLMVHATMKYNKTIKDGDIAPWKDLKKIWTKIKEKKKEITIF